jgi:hypothetical protein
MRTPNTIIPDDSYVLVSVNSLTTTTGTIISGGYQADVYMYSVKLDDVTKWPTPVDADIVVVPYWQVVLDEKRMLAKLL